MLGNALIRFAGARLVSECILKAESQNPATLEEIENLVAAGNENELRDRLE